MKRNSKGYQFLLTIHKYLGLATGLVVFLVSLSGAAWVFRDEITGLSEPTYTFDVGSDGPLISASEAKEFGQTVYPGRAIHGTLFTSPSDPVEVIFYQREPRFYRSVFLHPATGETLHVKDHLSGFFAWALRGHMFLWLPPEVGSPIVKYGVLVFLVILITGLIIWLPNKLKSLKRRLTFHWKPTTGWRRKNYDLHGIGGMYLGIFALLFAVTGSVIGLPWFYQITYRALGGHGDPSFLIPENLSPGPVAAEEVAEIPYDALIPRLMEESPEALGYEIHYPHSATSSVYVEIERDHGVGYRNDYRFFDQRTLEEIESPSVYAKYGDADLAKFVLRLNYDVHVGAIGGFFGKLLAFVASLLIASLPVTGMLIWYGRRKKGRRSVR